MLLQKSSFLSVIVRLHFLLLSALPLTGWAQETGNPVLRVPVRVHLMTGLEFTERGKNINTWMTPENFTTAVLPEINRIWKPAQIHWKVESVVLEAVGKGPGLPPTLQRIAKRETIEIATLRQLFPETGRHPEFINLYLVPSIGSANGVAGRAVKTAVVGIWRNKGPDDLQPAPLVMSRPPLASVAKTCAHELGHILGLVHPDERSIERLMHPGPGTALTPEEITTARERAAELAK